MAKRTGIFHVWEAISGGNKADYKHVSAHDNKEEADSNAGGGKRSISYYDDGRSTSEPKFMNGGNRPTRSRFFGRVREQEED